MIKAGYRKNEWLAVYVDENGERQILPFDTYEQAKAFLECCTFKVGVMTIWFYHANVEKVLYEQE